MSFFHAQSNFLSTKVEVVFENDGVVDMIAGPNTGSSYSLPGHVILSVPGLPVGLEGRSREVRSLVLMVEGKSEFFDDQGRYTPLRLYSATLTLAEPSRPLLLPSPDAMHPSHARTKLAVAFDLRLPGWLPPSHVSNMTTTSYGVVAHALLGWGDAISPSALYQSASTSSRPAARTKLATKATTEMSMHDFLSLDECLPASQPKVAKASRPKHSFETLFPNPSLQTSHTGKSASKFCTFSIRRHRLPSSIPGLTPERTERHYTLKPEKDSESPVECVVTVPDWVDVNGEEKSLKVSLRLRARRPEPAATSRSAAASSDDMTMGNDSMAEEETRELESVPMERHTEMKKEDDVATYMLELGMEVEEIEKFSSQPIPQFLSSFPIPAEQPSRHSSQHAFISPKSSHLDALSGTEERPFRGYRTKPCLLADDGNQRNFFFADDGLGLGDKWRKVNVVLPMPDASKLQHNRPSSEMEGPFLRIKHSLKIRVVCRGPTDAAEDTQVVILSTPIRFGTCPSTMPSANRSSPALPAYIQLFHENGELRECDALPLYTDTPDTPAPTYSESMQVAPEPLHAQSSPPPSPAKMDFTAEHSVVPPPTLRRSTRRK
ncbi:hypothetical protein P7C73_g25, partial [Tremellales sp. Uapishka_1]